MKQRRFEIDSRSNYGLLWRTRGSKMFLETISVSLFKQKCVALYRCSNIVANLFGTFRDTIPLDYLCMGL